MGCSSSSATSVAYKGKFAEEFLDEYLLGIKLGRGAFATVRDCSKIRVCASASWNDAWSEDDERKSKQSETAVKILDMSGLGGTETSQSLQQSAHLEAYCWNAIGVHPNCVRLHDLFFGQDFCYMLMEKCQSSLLQALERNQKLTERGLGNIASQMLTGIAHCHSVKVVHRDVKPNNFLVGGDDGVVKLADFGLSAMMPKYGKLQGAHGTPPYMSPEMLAKTGHDEKADVWSVGVLVYVLMYGQFPYTPAQKNAKAMKQVIVSGFPAPGYRPCPKASTDVKGTYRTPDAVDLVQTLLSRYPQHRPSAKDALTMPWIMAARQGIHRSSSDLPCLAPMVQAAKKCGAFGVCDALRVLDVTRETPADERLNKLQVERHGRELPLIAVNKAKLEKFCADRRKTFANFELWEHSDGNWENGSSRSTSCDSSSVPPTGLASPGEFSPPTSGAGEFSPPTSRAGSP